MTETAESDWLERAQAVTLYEQHAQPERADAAKRAPENLASVLSAIEQGMSFAAAAEQAGISRGTLTAWRKADETFDALCREAAARAYGEREVRIASDKNWKAQVSWLSARKHMFADPDWTAQERQAPSGITVNITLRQDSEPGEIDVTPATPVLEHDQD